MIDVSVVYDLNHIINVNIININLQCEMLCGINNYTSY